MSRQLLKIDLNSSEDDNLSYKLREFSPISRNSPRDISESPAKKFFSKQGEISPGSRNTLPNTIIKSFSSYNSEYPIIDINDIQEISDKVCRLEQNLDINLYLLKEKLELNKQLNEKLQILEKLKQRNKKDFGKKQKNLMCYFEGCNVF